MAMTLYGASQTVAAKAIFDFFTEMRTDAHAQDALREGLTGHPLENFHRFIGFTSLREDERRYLSADEVKRKYETNIGFRG